MHRIQEITIRGFRRLHDVKLEMRPLMVMVGANGVGKSTLLDGLNLLAHTTRGKLRDSLNELGGISSLATRGLSDSITLGANMAVAGHSPLEYTTRIAAQGHRYVIAEETLYQRHDRSEPFTHIEAKYDKVHYFDIDGGGLTAPNWDLDEGETALSQVPKMFRQPEEFRSALSSVAYYHALNVDKRAPVKLPQQIKPVAGPGLDGENLIPFLFGLREESPDRYEALVDTLRVAFPTFRSLSFPSVGAGVLTLTWNDKDFDEPLYIHELSEGTLRFLWLCSLLLTPKPSTITMIDEPEVSLHPEMLSVLVDLMREAESETQVIVATHSDSLIRFLDPDEVVIMNIDEKGCADPLWADSLDLDSWLSEYSLDELWRTGQLGGRS